MPHIPLNTSDEFRGISDAGSYGDVIEELDWSTGEIVEALKQNGVLDNTLIIFTSDNGPWLSYGNHGGSAGNLRGGKFDTWEGGFRVPAILHWPSVIERDQVTDQLVSAIDILPTLADITGSALPERSIDGISVLPCWRDHLWPHWSHEFSIISTENNSMQSDKARGNTYLSTVDNA